MAPEKAKRPVPVFGALATPSVTLDTTKECQGLRNRSQALLQLIEVKGAAAQQVT
jgi:hypothetical protein